MGFSKASIALCVAGIAVALVPTVLYIAYSQELSFLKMLEVEVVSGIPVYLGLSFLGVILTIVGLVTFVRAIRREQGPSLPYAGARPMPTAVSRPTQVRRPSAQQQPTTKSLDELVSSIEKELEEVVQKASVEHPSPQVQPQRPATAIKVVTMGMDEVCPSCGAVNPLGQKVCAECGADIYVEDPNLPACPVCGAPLKSPHKISDKVYVCRVCFSELEIPKEVSKKL
ncbi:MAG: hypothetical protein B9J98_04985 [Candidatus Terraquivivens tikiterensis]|uniref:DZANK-type domain-containing protein n=1 Tax=Candidatus Terraquivivens tikiterensis TaxID=1980982 RepID=A0A2R7Y3B8_9ARCH|nr:MAG: hypothetical protein B9J98_04985 [Candidatus Terraquivivens tikiterensis]